MDPFTNWNQWKKNFDTFFGEEFLNNFEGIFQYHHFPQINMYETENEIILLASIPGLNNVNNVDVFIDYQIVELKGNIDISFKGFKQTKDEIYKGFFERKIELPYPVKDDRVDATYQNGLLILHLHRLIPDHRSKQRVSVKAKDEKHYN